MTEEQRIIVRYLIGTVVEYILRISAVLFIVFKALELLGFILEWICNHAPVWMIPIGITSVIAIMMAFLFLDGNLKGDKKNA